MAIIIAYLMKTQNMTYEEAYQFVKSKRPVIHPNPGFKQLMIITLGFIRQLKEYYDELHNLS